jgi:SNF family Na+-dependent transporter
MTGSGGAIDGFVAQAREGGGLSDQEALAAGYKAYFNHFIGADYDGQALQSGHTLPLVVLLIVFSMNFACIYRGLSRGIEKLCNIGIPLLLLLSFAVLFRVLSLGTPDAAKPDQNLINGLGYMWNPNGEALRNPKAWLDAAGQIFFTLGVGFGIMINYSSYLRAKDDIALSSLTATAINEFSEVCHAGLITIPAAFIFLGVAALGADKMGSSFDVGFVVLPNVFDSMLGGRWFGFMWFFMLFVAAIAASVSMLQPCIAFLEEGLGLKRHASAALLGFLAALGCAFVLYFSEGSRALATFDFWAATVCMLLLALFQTILYGWVFGIERGHRELHRGAQIRVPRFIQFVLKYVTPTYLLGILGAFCYYKLGDEVKTLTQNRVALLSIGFVGAVMALLVWFTYLAGRRWQREGRLPASSRNTSG